MIEGILLDALRQAVSPTAAAYALLAIGLNLHFGFTGLLNFGQVGFMAVGAYGLAVTVSTFGGPLWLGIIIGLSGAAVLALILGIPTLRLRADYLAITTIAAAEILRFLIRFRGSEGVTGGVFGLRQFAGGFYDLNPLDGSGYLGPLQASASRVWQMVLGWTLVVLATLLVWALMRSPWGRVLRSIREDEDAARSLGKDVFAYKMQSLILGGMIGALGGVVFALSLQTVQPDTFLPQVTFYAFAILILGGTASTFGPIAGSVLFWFLIGGMQSGLRRFGDAGSLPAIVSGPGVGAVTLTFVGLLIMLLMIFRPQGMLGNKRELQLDV
jgi:branched-chain amino acid transport system permease protein